MPANNFASGTDKALETAVRACIASMECSLLYEARDCLILAEHWRQEAAKVIRYMCRNFPLDAVIRACDEYEMLETEQ